MFKHGEDGRSEGNVECLGPFVDYEFSKTIHRCAVKGLLSTYLHIVQRWHHSCRIEILKHVNICMYKQPASRTDNLPVHADLIAGVEDTE